MKTGKKSILELAQEIDNQQQRKQDMVVDTRALELSDDGTKIAVLDGGKRMWSGRLTDHAHHNIAERLRIHRQYYDRMRGAAPALLKQNIEHWFRAEPKRRMVRGMNGDADHPQIARAFLSERYARIDNHEVLNVTLPILKEVPDLKIESCEVTDQRLYVKAVTSRKTLNIKKGDPVQAGVMITNSEIGMGPVMVTPLLFRLVCLNGLVLQDSRFRQVHIGGRADKSDALYSMLSDETLKADDRAVLLKVRDVMKAALSEAFLAEKVEQLQSAAKDEFSPKANPVKAMEVLGNSLGLNGQEQGSVLQHLIKGGDLSRWGVINAVTRAAQDVESYDRSTEMEIMGGTILNLPRKEWTEIAHAA